MKNSSEEELIMLCKQDSMEAFGILISRYKAALCIFIEEWILKKRFWSYHDGDSNEQAENIFQDIVLKIMSEKLMRKYDTAKGKFSTWFCTLSHNHAIDMHRRPNAPSRFTHIPIEEFDELALNFIDRVAPENICILNDLRRLSLSMFDRDPCIMRCLHQEYLQQEIAAEFGIPIGTVKTVIRRNRLKFRSLL